MVQQDPAVLTHSLKSLLLCCCSPMGSAVDALVSSYRLKLGLEISGKPNPGYSLFVEMARRLGVSFEEVEIPPRLASTPMAWMSDRSTPSERVWIPDMKYREGDFHVLFPFYLRYHLLKLREQDPNFPAPKIDNLYVVLIWSQCFGPNRVPLSAMVLRDLVAWEGARELTAHVYRAPAANEMAVVSEKVNSLSDFAQRYLGFSGGAEGPEIMRKSGLDEHLFNRYVLYQSGASLVRTDQSSPMRCALLVRRFTWDVEDMAVITKNAWALHIHPALGSESARKLIEACLICRLVGMTEDEIWRELLFESSEQYYRWQVSRAIDIDRNRFKDPYDEWLKACDMFSLEPEIILSNVREEEGSPPNEERAATLAEDFRISRGDSDPSTDLKDPIRAEMCADVEGVVLKSGGRIVCCHHRALSFTRDQAKIVSIYFDNYLKGNDYLPEQDALESAELSKSRFDDLFRSRREEFEWLFENHSTEKDLWRFKSDL